MNEDGRLDVTPAMEPWEYRESRCRRPVMGGYLGRCVLEAGHDGECLIVCPEDAEQEGGEIKLSDIVVCPECDNDGAQVVNELGGTDDSGRDVDVTIYRCLICGTEWGE